MTNQSASTQRGFTLIELLIAIAIIGILAAVVYPSYAAHVRRGKIAAALGELSAVRVRLEQYYQDHRHYGSSGSGCGVAMPASPGFIFTCSWGPGATSQSFMLTATGDAAAGMAGHAYTVDESDRQATVQFEGAAVNMGCWIKRKGETC